MDDGNFSRSTHLAKIKSAKSSTEILDYRHKEAKRKNNPEEGLAIYLPEEKIPKVYSYDPHLEPQLIYAGKIEHSKFEVPVVPLHIHERLTPRNIIGILEKRRSHQLRLFDEAVFPLDRRVEFYKHDMDWTNRLILGDSLLVMNSLLTKELMAGKVQMIYIDPPYGISYNSNFQPEINQLVVKDGDDTSLTRETEQIRAYRDTWSLGVHSYLAYLKDRLLLCRELLAEMGSVFVQISDENLHHVRELLDEVFGPENFMSVITFRKKNMPLGARYLEGVSDYLVWYARDKKQVKYHQLFREYSVQGDNHWNMVELPDGNRRRMTTEEINNHKLLPKGSIVYRYGAMFPAGVNPSGFFNVKLRGKEYKFPSGKGWKTTPDGMKKLIGANRVEPWKEGETLGYVIKLTDGGGLTPITNVWEDTALLSDKMYVVQTSTTAIARCMLMTTDPGDLVLDPTCGSGTTAFVAENWGRRWITCDTSRVATSIARQRMLTASFPYFQLSHPDESIKSGFVYRKISKVSFTSIAQTEPPEIVELYDQPVSDDTAVRITGPFTFEAIPAPSTPVEEMNRGNPESAENYVSALIESMQETGILFPRGKRLKLERLVAVASSGFLHAEGVTSNGESKRLAISFGPRYGPLGARQTEEAIRAANVAGYQMLVLAGFQIDPAAEAFVQRTNVKLDVQFAHINPDMEIHDLLKQTQGSQLFSVFGEPDIELKKIGKGEMYVVRLLGVDIYDPITGNTEQTSGDSIPAWFLDEDYDGYSFNICQAFFPDGATGKNPWDKLENALHGIIEKEKIEQLKGKESLPFELGKNKTIAVKVFDNRGNEVIKLRKLVGPQKV